MNINEIKTKAFKFNFNTLLIKVKVSIFKEDNIMILSIGLSNPASMYKYENWITKYSSIDVNGEVTFGNKYLENPPFKFYAKWLLVDNSLDLFFDEILLNLRTKKDTDICVYRDKIKNSFTAIEKLYTETLVKLPKTSRMSTSTKRLVDLRFDERTARKIKLKCQNENMTVRFTNDITRYKRLKLD